jgi:hypothetical protein
MLHLHTAQEFCTRILLRQFLAVSRCGNRRESPGETPRAGLATFLTGDNNDPSRVAPDAIGVCEQDLAVDPSMTPSRHSQLAAPGEL